MPLAHFAVLGLGTPELLIILVILVLLFGANKLPALSKSIGQSVRELKGGLNDAKEVKKDLTTQVAEAKSVLKGAKTNKTDERG